MKSPKISVLMPNYNCEKYLSESIESILNQSFTDFEFIIIDDGSSDKSWKIIQDYAKQDKRIIAIKNKENLWISWNRNKLLEKAKWKYIVWQDSDDISMHDRIEKQYEYMKLHTDIWACWWWLQFFNESSDTSQRLYAEIDSEIRKTIFKYSPLPLPWSMMLREAVEKSWGFQKWLNVAEDLDLSFRIWQKYKFWNIKDIVLRYRESWGSATFKNLKKMEIETIKIRWKNHKTQYYSMTLFDKIYNLLQYLSIYIIPTKIKIKLFNLIRNS